MNRQYNLLFLIFKLFICQRYKTGFVYQKLIKQLPFYEKTIKPRVKKFTNAKLLSELTFFEKPKKAKIKQLTTKKLLQEQLFYKPSIKKTIL